MKKLLIISLSLSVIVQITSYILPQTFREWTIIGIDKDINKHKPYHYKIGELPMVLWFNKTRPHTIINTCHKHLGNTLKDSYVKNDKLICPFHNSSYTSSDGLGDIQIRNGLVWWSFKSFKKEPPRLRTDNQENYLLKVNSDLISILLNFINDYGGDKDNYKFVNKKLLIKKDRDFLIYKYPYTMIFNNRYMINIIPEDINKSYLYLTTLKGTYIDDKELRKFKGYLEKRFNNFRFKYYLLKNDNSIIYKIYDLYKNYMFINDFTINHFLINKNFY